MSGPKRNPDRLNTIGIVVVGLCGAVLVYVTIVALQAFYVNDTSEIQTIADYGGQDITSKSLRSDQLSRIGGYASNPPPAAPKANEAARPQSFRIPIDVAMKLVVEGGKTDPSSLIPTLGRSDKATVLPIFGRPKPLPAAAPAPGAAPAAGADAQGAGAQGAATTLPSAPQVPTGTGTGPSPVGGAGPLDKPATPGTPGNPSGPTPGNAPRGASAAGSTTNAGPAAKAPKTSKTTAPKGNGK